MAGRRGGAAPLSRPLTPVGFKRTRQALLSGKRRQRNREVVWSSGSRTCLTQDDCASRGWIKRCAPGLACASVVSDKKPRERRPMGALEAEVLARLWEGPGPLTPGEVLAAMGDELSYTTIMTILTRLANKGLATRERRGKAYEYRPRMSEAELTASRMNDTLMGSDDHAAALSRFVDRLSPRDERLLRRILGDIQDQ